MVVDDDRDDRYVVCGNVTEISCESSHSVKLSIPDVGSLLTEIQSLRCVLV